MKIIFCIILLAASLVLAYATFVPLLSYIKREERCETKLYEEALPDGEFAMLFPHLSVPFTIHRGEKPYGRDPLDR